MPSASARLRKKGHVPTAAIRSMVFADPGQPVEEGVLQTCGDDAALLSACICQAQEVELALGTLTVSTVEFRGLPWSF